MAAKNVLEIDLASTPDLQALFGGLEPGEKITFEVTCVTQESSPKVFRGMVEKVAAEEEEEAAEPDATEPTSMTMKPMMEMHS